MKNAMALLRDVIAIRQLDSSEVAEVSQRGSGNARKQRGFRTLFQNKEEPCLQKQFLASSQGLTDHYRPMKSR
jgi:hypothetical protein